MSVKPTNIYAYLYSCCVLLFIIVSLLTCNTIKTPQHNSNFIDDAPKWLAQSNRVQMLGYKIFTDNNIFYHNLSIHIDNKEVYHNPNALFSTYYDILPIIRELKTDNIEVLIAYADDVNYHLKILRLLFHQHALIKQDTLPLFNGSHTDTDQDGYVEFSGFLSPNKPYCIGCDSVYYNPLLTYEMRDDGISFDHNATRLWIENHYTDFYGFWPDTSIIVAIRPYIK